MRNSVFFLQMYFYLFAESLLHFYLYASKSERYRKGVSVVERKRARETGQEKLKLSRSV